MGPPSNQRKYPRHEIYAQQRLLHLTDENQFIKNVVVAKNFSASGFCFRSSRHYEPGLIFFVCGEDDILEDLKANRARIMKAGNYFMAKVIWNRPALDDADPFYEIGCAFLQLKEGNLNSLNLFTRLMNHFTVHEILNGDRNSQIARTLSR